VKNILSSDNFHVGRGAAAAMLVGVGVLSTMLTSCKSDSNPAKPAAAKATPSSSTISAKKTIAWGACPQLAKGATRDPREKCGTVRVPLDYRHPGGKSISIAVSRIATAKPGKRRGALFLNPGGPAL
jgi:hypothetical protein